jgi:hypothetical protein
MTIWTEGCIVLYTIEHTDWTHGYVMICKCSKDRCHHLIVDLVCREVGIRYGPSRPSSSTWIIMPTDSLSTKTEISNIDWLMGNILPEGTPKLVKILSYMTVWLCSCILLSSVQFVGIILEILLCHKILLHVAVPLLELTKTVVSLEQNQWKSTTITETYCSKNQHDGLEQDSL